MRGAVLFYGPYDLSGTPSVRAAPADTLVLDGPAMTPGIAKLLPDRSEVTMTVPFMRAWNPISETNWEGVGVEPDVKVPAKDALDKAQALALEAIKQQ